MNKKNDASREKLHVLPPKKRRSNKLGCVLVIMGIVFLFIMLVGGYFFYHSAYVQKTFIYKWPFVEAIAIHSADNELDPCLVISVIRNESRFKDDAISPRGAVGLMQITPETGIFIAKATNSLDFREEFLKLPELNIKFGCWYLQYLLEMFKGNEILALAAYNAGPGKVAEWMIEKDWNYKFNNIKEIPVEETKYYVYTVLLDRERYKQYYGPEGLKPPAEQKDVKRKETK